MKNVNQVTVDHIRNAISENLSQYIGMPNGDKMRALVKAAVMTQLRDFQCRGILATPDIPKIEAESDGTKITVRFFDEHTGRELSILDLVKRDL